MGVGPGLSRSHLNSAVELGSFDPTLRHCGYHFVVVPQWFINFSADPQLVEQYSQLSGHGNDGSFLGILSSALGQPQSPSPQITVLSKGTENIDAPCTISVLR